MTKDQILINTPIIQSIADKYGWKVSQTSHSPQVHGLSITIPGEDPEPVLIFGGINQQNPNHPISEEAFFRYISKVLTSRKFGGVIELGMDVLKGEIAEELSRLYCLKLKGKPVEFPASVKVQEKEIRLV